MKSKILSIAILFLFVGASAPLFGQVGKIYGEVTDPDGNPIQGVEIRIEGMDINNKYKLKTDKKGKFVHAGVRLQGTYRVIAEKEGFQPDYVEGVRPGFGDDQGEVNFQLKPGQGGVLAFELSDEDRERIRKQNEQAQKQAESNAKLKEYFAAGQEAFENGEYETALEYYQAANEIDDQQPAIWANLGNAHHKVGEIVQAVEAYETAVSLDPENPTLYQNLGNLYAEQGNADKAQEIYEQGAKISADLDPKAAAGTYYNLGVTHINNGQNKEALEALTKAIEFDETHAEAHFQLGLTLLGVNRIQDSLKHLKRYLELAPAGPNAATAQALVEQLGG